MCKGVQRLKGASSESLCDAETLLRQIMVRNKDSMMKMSYMQLQTQTSHMEFVDKGLLLLDMMDLK